MKIVGKLRTQSLKKLSATNASLLLSLFSKITLILFAFFLSVPSYDDYLFGPGSSNLFFVFGSAIALFMITLLRIIGGSGIFGSLVYALTSVGLCLVVGIHLGAANTEKIWLSLVALQRTALKLDSGSEDKIVYYKNYYDVCSSIIVYHPRCGSAHSLRDFVVSKSHLQLAYFSEVQIYKKYTAFVGCNP